SANKTGKGISKWEFLTEMNEIFGNRENVHPDYRINSTGEVITNIAQPKKKPFIKKKKA
ncbi:11637_t:CDS:2, partial [Dentiscutata heterogama]